MTKTKQATLFSLKSWKNVATEGIQKYKDVLASHDEAEILKALISLKRKNFSRDVILSAGIDLSLKLLEKHQNPRIRCEAQLLRSYWQLNKNCSPEIILLDNIEPPSKKRRTLPEEVCEIKITHKQTIECDERLAVDHLQQKQVPNKAFSKDSNKSVLIAAAKPVKLDFKSPSVNKTTYNNIIHKLHAAIKLFTQELGEQEVRLYLGKDVKESSSL